MSAAKRKTKERRREVLLVSQGGICSWCGNPLASDEMPTLDHIRPRSHGGTNLLDNLRLLHGACNAEKGDACPGCPGCAPGAQRQRGDRNPAARHRRADPGACACEDCAAIRP